MPGRNIVKQVDVPIKVACLPVRRHPRRLGLVHVDDKTKLRGQDRIDVQDTHAARLDHAAQRVGARHVEDVGFAPQDDPVIGHQ